MSRLTTIDPRPTEGASPSKRQRERAATLHVLARALDVLAFDPPRLVAGYGPEQAQALLRASEDFTAAARRVLVAPMTRQGFRRPAPEELAAMLDAGEILCVVLP